MNKDALHIVRWIDEGGEPDGALAWFDDDVEIIIAECEEAGREWAVLRQSDGHPASFDFVKSSPHFPKEMI